MIVSRKIWKKREIHTFQIFKYLKIEKLNEELQVNLLLQMD